jgi:large subunit ribosomal protein L25
MEKRLDATRREADGKGAARRLRAAGKVPAVVYGRGLEPVSVAVDSRDLYHVLHTEAGTNVLIELRVGRERHLTMPREIQRDHIKGRFIHVDFLEVRRDVKITVDVPVELVGESHGVKEGGVVEHHLWDIKLECLPGDVPERIEVDISRLGIGDSIRVADLTAPGDTTIVSDPDSPVVAVMPPPILRLEEEEEEELVEAVEGEEALAEAEGATAEEAAGQVEGTQGEGEGS